MLFHGGCFNSKLGDNMKRIAVLFCIIMIAAPMALADFDVGMQDPVCTSRDPDMPLAGTTVFTQTQYCIAPADLPVADETINEICWHNCVDTADYGYNVEVWLQNATPPCANIWTAPYPQAGMTKVYDGALTVDGTIGWQCLVLDTPFDYVAGESLVVMVCGDQLTGSVAPEWAASASGDSRLAYDDYTDSCGTWGGSWWWDSMQTWIPSTRFKETQTIPATTPIGISLLLGALSLFLVRRKK